MEVVFPSLRPSSVVDSEQVEAGQFLFKIPTNTFAVAFNLQQVCTQPTIDADTVLSIFNKQDDLSLPQEQLLLETELPIRRPLHKLRRRRLRLEQQAAQHQDFVLPNFEGSVDLDLGHAETAPDSSPLLSDSSEISEDWIYRDVFITLEHFCPFYMYKNT